MSEKDLFDKGHNACAGCGPAIAMRHIMKAAGKNTIISIATGCIEVVSTPYPLTAWNVPLIHNAFENAAATASGVEKALEHLGKKDVNVIAIAGDGGTFDIGLQALSGMIERGHNILFICYDNAAYMNTGIQRSGATPRYAETTTSPYGNKIHGKQENKKNIPQIMAAHRCYVATANVAYPEDFQKKIKKALSIKGPKYIQVFSPCTAGWKYPENLTIQVAKKAVETRVNILYEIENGIYNINIPIEKPKEVKDYTSMQGRFKNLNEKEINEIKNNVNAEYEKIKKLSDSKTKVF